MNADDAIRFETLMKEGIVASGHGEWQEAFALFGRARQIKETPEILEHLGWSAWWLNKPEVSLEALERSYQMYSEAGDRRGSARTAVWLARARMEFKGEHAIASGWLQRAHSHLEGMEETAELGWLRLFEGQMMLFGKKEPAAAREIARQCIALGRKLRESDIEMWGRALDGFALVMEGDVPAGMQQLDEAGAIGVGGEAKDLNAIAATCCYLIEACERAADHQRAAQWYERTRDICRRWHFGPLFAICKTQYAGILISSGDWTQAESELLSARQEIMEYRPSMVTMCDLRIAELRRRQGRLDEAKSLFAASESSPISIYGRGMMALEEGDAASALDLAKRYLRRVRETDKMQRVPGLLLEIRTHARLGQASEASAAVSELLKIAQTAPIDHVRASASLGAGLLSFIEDDLETARQQFEDSVDLFERAGMPYDSAYARLELAKALQELDRPDRAQAEAERARASHQKLGAVLEEKRCLTFLKSLLKDTAPLVREALRKSGLTKREAEVLILIAEGRPNDEIAENLFLSIRTVERHISSIYQKIGVTGKAARAAAVAFAAKAGLIG